MVSGVGPKETLAGLDIPVIKDLPGVGQNMWVKVIQTGWKFANFTYAK